MKSLCCNYEFNMECASIDSLGFCTTCPICKGSFDVDMRTISFPEAMTLKEGDEVFVRIENDLIKSEVVRRAFWNSDADEPDWEIETTNGFCDIYSLYKVNNEIEKGNDNMFILEAAYELYKQNWIDTHTTPQMRLNAARDYQLYKQECLDNVESFDTFEEWIYEQGYEGGGLYVSFDEFIDNEFNDKEYMKELLGVVLSADYLLTINHAEKEVK